MKIWTLTHGLLCLVFISGCIEKETELTLYYANATNRTIQVFTYPGDPFSSSSDSSWFNLSSFEKIGLQTTSVRGEYSSLPNGIFPSFSKVDSCVVVFSDTLQVTHFTRSYSLDQDTIREDVIAYGDSRNMLNQEYFNIESTGEHFKATYTFTEEDIEYAISINE